MEYQEAKDHLFRWSNSFDLMPQLIAMRAQMASDDWLQLLGEAWSSCDNIGLYRLELRRLLPASGPVMEMMTSDEQAAYQSLPERLKVFRGCGPNNLRGACWSLKRDVAARFPALNRYQEAEPLLVTATVRRHRVLAVKLDRNEDEIITFQARRTAIELLPFGCS